jgi:hypothetical protein
MEGTRDVVRDGGYIKGGAVSERDEQIAVFDVLRLNEAEYPFLKWIHASMNGLHSKSARMAADRKRQGQRSGVSDIFIPISRRDTENLPIHGAFIEMKVKPNRLTPEQQEFISFVERQGYLAYTAYSADAALNFIEMYCGIKLRGRK